MVFVLLLIGLKNGTSGESYGEDVTEPINFRNSSSGANPKQITFDTLKPTSLVLTIFSSRLSKTKHFLSLFVVVVLFVR